MTVRAFPQAGAVGGKVCCCILGIYLAFAGINDRFAVVFPLLDSGGADDAESVFLEEFCGASRAASTVASGDDLFGFRNLGEPALEIPERDVYVPFDGSLLPDLRRIAYID